MQRILRAALAALLALALALLAGCQATQPIVRRVGENQYVVRRADGTEREVVSPDKALDEMTPDEIYQFLEGLDAEDGQAAPAAT